MKKIYLFLIMLFVLSSCRTQFYGSPYIEEGRFGCEKICASWDMELVGMVAMGEYSNGCICQKPEADLSINEVGQSIILSSKGTGAAVAAMLTQMQNEDDEAAARSHR
ncbi:MAG: hypothetical protein HKN68_16795 [Saprospiraceae bacterium]|nr:hypothetical protein [Saprospiraceae bacterium]